MEAIIVLTLIFAGLYYGYLRLFYRYKVIEHRDGYNFDLQHKTLIKAVLDLKNIKYLHAKVTGSYLDVEGYEFVYVVRYWEKKNQGMSIEPKNKEQEVTVVVVQESKPTLTPATRLLSAKNSTVKK